MSNQIRIGLIGASWFADLWFLPVLTRHPHVQVAAICSKNGTNARVMADKYGIPAVFTSAVEMMDSEQLDGVCIVTPNETHYPLTMAALDRGLHILCEKPLAVNGEQSAMMRQTAERKGIVHAVNFSFREHPGVQFLRKALKDGELGQFLEGRFEYAGDYGSTGSPGWRGSIQEAGAGGVLQDLGSHIIDLAQYVLEDQIVALQSSVRCLESGRLVDFSARADRDQAADSVYFLADFQSGAHCTFQTSWISPQGNNGQTVSLELHGTEASLLFHTSCYGSRLLYGKVGENWREISLPDQPVWDKNTGPGEDRMRPYRNSERNESWKWADAILQAKSGGRGKTTALAGFADADDVQHVIDAVILSGETKRKVQVSR